jgi:hypothetical protein
MRPGKSGPGRVANWSPATISVPAGEAQATRSELRAARWHMEDVCSASYIEHVRALQDVRQCLAVADETQAAVGRHFVRDAVHVATPAPKQQNLRVASHKT